MKVGALYYSIKINDFSALVEDVYLITLFVYSL